MSNISIQKYPEELTLSLNDFLSKHNLKLVLVESRLGYWLPRLVGARTPEYYSRRAQETVPPSEFLARSEPTQSAALRAAAERLTQLNALLLDDGTKIDIRNTRVTAE